MKRKGLSLVEVMVALTLACGPVLVSLVLIHANVDGSRFANDRATARMVLVDLAELVRARPVAELAAVARTRSVESLLAERIAALPEPARAPYAQQLRSLEGRLSLEVEQDVDGLARLTRLTLAARLDRSGAITVTRLFRAVVR